jgi:tyrosine-protein kinase Etk/Wzc
VLTGLATSLSESQQKLAEADARFNAAAPEVREQRAQVDSQLGAIRSYVSNRLSRSREALSKLNGIIGQYEGKLKTVPGAELGLAQLTRESEVYSSVYSFLLKRQQETAIVKASTISKNRILDTAEVPYREKWPALWLPMAGLIMGLLLASVVVLLRGQVSGRLQNGVEVKRYLGRIPVVATVPHVTLPRKLAASGALSAQEAERLSAVYLEAFRTLRINLYEARTRGIGNVVLLTSPCKGDGKTTCAYSLASTLARAGTSVLLVDTDLHDGVGRSRDDDTGGRDLRAVLKGWEPWRNVVQAVTVPSGCSFHVMHGGPASAELLLTPTMRQFVTDARTSYDFVILDSTSFPGLSDALVLMPLADCVLSVIRLEHTHRKLAAENVQRLSATAAPYGVILNDVRS